MAVSKMKLVNIIGHLNALDAVIFACGKTGVFQPDETLTFFSNNAHFSALNETNPYTDTLNRLESAVSRVGGELKEVMVDIAPDINKEELTAYVDDFSNRVVELTKRRGQLSTKVEQLNRDTEQFEHFLGLDIDMDAILACKIVKIRFGRLPKKSFEKLAIYDANPYVLFFPGCCDGEYYWGVYFAPPALAAEVDRVFSGLYFERMKIPAAVGTPEEIVQHLRDEKAQVEQELKQLDQQISAIWQEERDKCQKVYSKLRLLSYYHSARHYAAKHNDKFILTGWIPAKEEQRFKIALDAVDAIDYTVDSPDADTHHSPPVKLKNPKLFKPFEFLVDMFGSPRYNEIDPTLFVAITYTLLFGIMFGDLGQGICVAIAGWLMWKLKKMQIGKILIPCGISSAIFGLVFGSVFGFEHVLDPLYHALFGLAEKPIEVMNPSMTGKILLVSAGLGPVLILISMLLNVYSSLKRKDYVNGLFGPSGLAGVVFYASVVLGLVSQLAGLFKLSIPYILFLVVLPLLLIYLREPLGHLVARKPDWQPESWGEYLLQNFFELFEALLSYLSNTMSFLRVGAFVLVHAGMMMAVFTLAGLTSGIGYILIVVLGNGLVMAMEALLVAIQVMRLEYYEMFSRYYVGDGRPFKPLDVGTGEKVFSDRA